jgi:hypothetical protein
MVPCVCQLIKIVRTREELSRGETVTVYIFLRGHKLLIIINSDNVLYNYLESVYGTITIQIIPWMHTLVYLLCIQVHEKLSAVIPSDQ